MTRYIKSALWHITLTATLIVVLAWSTSHIKSALTSEPGILTE